MPEDTEAARTRGEVDSRIGPHGPRPGRKRGPDRRGFGFLVSGGRAAEDLWTERGVSALGGVQR